MTEMWDPGKLCFAERPCQLPQAVSSQQWSQLRACGRDFEPGVNPLSAPADPEEALGARAPHTGTPGPRLLPIPQKPQCLICQVGILVFVKILFIYFRERRRKGEKEGEKY